MRYIKISVISLALAIPALVMAQEQTMEDMTSKIVNPSFEENGFEGWVNSGMQIQNNESPADVGWPKDGTYYAEKWVSAPSSCGMASVTQDVAGLENGEYLLRIVGHSVNQSGTPEQTTGTFVVAGSNRTPVPAFGEYEVTATVAEGKLLIGFVAENPDANWVAVDNFRLYRTGENMENYKKYLDEILAELNAELAADNVPANYNTTEIEDALALAAAATTKEEILAAIEAVRSAQTNFVSIKKNYGRLRSRIAITEDLMANSDYAGKEALQQAIDAAKAVYDNPESTGADLAAAVDALKEASAAYIANRPEQWVTIKNGAMWKDADGNPVQAHGAGFLLVNDTWYMIGEDRSSSWNPDVNMYSSKDLVNWKFERKIIQNRVTHPSLGNGRMIERPKLMYCDATGQFVVWCHWEASNYGASEAGVFYSEKVNDPYTYYSGERPLGIKSRDCNVFVDDDGTAYFISTIEENTHLGLFRLSDDYLKPQDYVTLFRNQKREAPAIVRVGDIYYMLSSACSGWDPNQCKLATSASLSSGWSGLKSLGNNIAYDTQPASILTIKGTKATTYLFVGDRWQDPNLPESKTIIFPISFDDKNCVYAYRDQFDINFVTGEWRETPVETSKRIDKSGWTVIDCSSEEVDKENGAVANAIDGDYGTKWHTRYSSPAGKAPHHITVDMGEKHNIGGILAAPRNDNSSNGLIREFALQVSDDAENWTMVSGGAWMPYWGEVAFQPVEARYIKLTSLSGDYAAVSEIDVVGAGLGYEPLELKPYVKIDGGPWQNITDIEIEADQRLQIRASVDNMPGTWVMETPDSIFVGRDLTIPYPDARHSGEYNAFFLDMYSQTHKLTFNIKVNGESGVDDAMADEEPVSVEFFNLSGIKVDESRLSKGVYIKREHFRKGKPRISKLQL